MLPHKYRLFGFLIYGVVQIALVVVDEQDWVSNNGIAQIQTILAALFTLAGLADAANVEMRRRNPAQNALKDDVIKTTMTRQKRVPNEPIASDDINTPGPFHVPPGVREDTPTE